MVRSKNKNSQLTFSTTGRKEQNQKVHLISIPQKFGGVSELLYLNIIISFPHIDGVLTRNTWVLSLLKLESNS